MLTVGSLFAGIGGFDLGLERAGMRVAWQVEFEPWCHFILNKHWPDVPCYSDIRDVRGKEVGYVDVLAGGFPCQDISSAGKRAGIEGARSSLWKEYARLVDEVRPRYVIVENVSALRRRGLDVVLGDLSALGYDAEWDCLRASDFGAPHRRDRLWLVAYTNSLATQPDGEPELVGGSASGYEGTRGERQRLRDAIDSGRTAVADAAFVAERESATQADSEPGSRETRRVFGGGSEQSPAARRLGAQWTSEPDVGRVADGVPARTHRLRGLGNALVPQIAQWIGERIVAYEVGIRPGVQSDQERVA